MDTRRLQNGQTLFNFGMRTDTFLEEEKTHISFHYLLGWSVCVNTDGLVYRRPFTHHYRDV
jgi:hypothetical protein